jgi:hypothetical protein
MAQGDPWTNSGQSYTDWLHEYEEACRWADSWAETHPPKKKSAEQTEKEYLDNGRLLWGR